MSAQTRDTTRRAVVAGLAVAPAAALPAVACASPAPADPIFDAIAEFERMKASELAAWKAYNDLEEATASALEAAGIEPTQIEALTGLDGPETEHQAMWRAVEELEESSRAAAEARGEAEREFVTTAPTTRAGALRLLHHLAEFLSDDDVVNDRFLEDVVGDAIRNAIAVFESEALA